MKPAQVSPVDPEAIRLEGVRAVRRTIHSGPRGLLVEMLRRDDTELRGGEFAMSYASVTLPGEFRDRDRWHVHRVQTDRFTVVLGEMILALFDSRSGSPTRGLAEIVRMRGAPYAEPATGGKEDRYSWVVPIPPGVFHCIGNLSTAPFLLINFPTELYNDLDEGRVPFRDVRIDALDGTFEWARVATGSSLP